MSPVSLHKAWTLLTINGYCLSPAQPRHRCALIHSRHSPSGVLLDKETAGRQDEILPVAARGRRGPLSERRSTRRAV